MTLISEIRSILNFRDAGGYPIPGGRTMTRGVIYRSANPDRVSRRDLERLRKLGIKTVIDLRGPAESSGRSLDIPGIRVIGLPLDFAGVTRQKLKPYIKRHYNPEEINRIINGLYIEIVDAARPVMGRVAEVMLEPESRPLLIHCQAGKDRTGILVALFQMVAGIEREDIVNDYMTSNDHLIPHFERKIKLRQLLMLGLFPSGALLHAIRQKREDIETAIDRISGHYGGVEEYLAGSGFDMARYDALRDILVTG